MAKIFSPTWAGVVPVAPLGLLRIAVALLALSVPPLFGGINSTVTLKPGVLNAPYSVAVPNATKNLGYAYSIVSGKLPSGIILDAQNGVLSGKPGQTGTFTFTVRATSATTQIQRDFSLTVTAATGLSVMTSVLPPAALDVNYATTLSASGGNTPYTWTVSSGQLPTGVWLARYSGVLSGKSSQTGVFSFQVQITDHSGQVATRNLTFTVNPPSAGKGITIPAGFSGMHINLQNTPWPSVPVGAVRLWDSGTGWAQVETANGTYDWSVLDTRVNQALAAGADVLYNLGRTPTFAQCSPTNRNCGSGVAVTCSYDDGSNGTGQCYPPNDLTVTGGGSDQHWIDWVTAVANRYRTRIKFYEIWNEPDIGGMWQGTNAQLVRMEQDAHCIIVGTGCNSLSHYSQTGIDPSASVTTPAFTSTSGLTVANAMSAFLQAGGGSYADVIAFHGYLGRDKDPECVLNTVATMQNAVASASQQGKPIFDTEGSWGSVAWITDPDQQQSFVARYMLLQQSAGIRRFYWYSWDKGSAPLWSRTAGVSPAGMAHGQVSEWITGATLTSACMNNGSVWTCSYTKPGGYQAMAVWDSSQTCSGGVCTTSSFVVPAGYTHRQDLDGNKTSVSSTVRIGLKPILLENQ